MIDDFCQQFAPVWNRHLITNGQKKRCRSCSLSLSERMTLVVLFHPLRHRQFKRYDTDYVCRYLRAQFPGLPSHGRVIERLPRCAPALSALLPQLQGGCTGLLIVDATRLRCAIPCASANTVYFVTLLHAAKVLRAGFTA